MSITSEAIKSQGAVTLKLRSARIRDLAELKGFGRMADMAREFGLSRPHLSQLLNHHYLPSLPTAQRMAAKLEIKVEDLYEGES